MYLNILDTHIPTTPLLPSTILSKKRRINNFYKNKTNYMRDNNISKNLDNDTVNKNSEIQNLILIQHTNSHIFSSTKIKIVKSKE